MTVEQDRASDPEIDTLVVLAIASEQLDELRQVLIQERFYFTHIEGGGLIPRARLSLLIGINKRRLEALLELIRFFCGKREKFIPAQVDSPLYPSHVVVIEAEAGGALAFILEVERFLQF